MIRKAVIVVLTLGAVMTGLGWASTYSRKFEWYRFNWESMRITWRVRWGEAVWSTNAPEYGDHTEGFHVRAYRGNFTICSHQQPQQNTTAAIRGFDWQFFSYKYGVEQRVHRGGQHRVRRFRSIFAVPLVALSVYPTIAFIRGPLRRWRRRKRGECVNCGYNLTGNVTGVCSECGVATARSRSALTQRFNSWYYPDLRRFPTPEHAQAALAKAEAGIRRSHPVYFVVWFVIVIVWAFLRIEAEKRGAAAVSAWRWSSLLIFGGGILYWTSRRTIARSLWRQLAQLGIPCCIDCGYDLTGNVSGVCPECGTKIEAP